jgi:hypothetical protein
MKLNSTKHNLKQIILLDKNFNSYYEDILEWLNKQPLLLISTDPEVSIRNDKLEIKFQCLGEKGIYYEPFYFLFRETEEYYIISNNLDTVIPSFFNYDFFTFPLIVQGEIKIKKF